MNEHEARRMTEMCDGEPMELARDAKGAERPVLTQYELALVARLRRQAEWTRVASREALRMANQMEELAELRLSAAVCIERGFAVDGAAIMRLLSVTRRDFEFQTVNDHSDVVSDWRAAIPVDRLPGSNGPHL